MEVAMATRLFIGIVLGVVLVLAFLSGRGRKVLSLDEQGPHHDEQRRRADVVAADAARMAEAKTPPYQGGYPI
jgi:hypothetical protein